eukprot:930927-Pleurochrysis_carterae.AAC.1
MDNTDATDNTAPSPPGDGNDEAPATNDDNNKGTSAERILRRRRQTAAVVALDLLTEPTKHPIWQE